jgi:hypothetical protein
MEFTITDLQRTEASHQRKLRISDAGMTTDEFISGRLALREIVGKFCKDYNMKLSPTPQIILRRSMVRNLNGRE